MDTEEENKLIAKFMGQFRKPKLRKDAKTFPFPEPIYSYEKRR